MHKFIVTIVALTATTLAGCENVRVGGSFGSFGSSGGVGVSASTDVPTGGSKNPPPFEQVFIEQTTVDELFPAREIPFTAETDEIKALQKYLGDDTNTTRKEQLSSCKSGKARCRINLLTEENAD